MRNKFMVCHLAVILNHKFLTASKENPEAAILFKVKTKTLYTKETDIVNLSFPKKNRRIWACTF